MSRPFSIQSLIEDALGEIINPGDAARSFFVDNHSPRYAMGRNEDTLAVNRVIPLDGLIDDYFPGDQWHGIPIIKTDHALAGALVINTSTSISPVDVDKALSRMPHLKSVGLHQVIAASQGLLNWPRFVKQMRDEIREHLDAWVALYEQLADEQSRQTLRDTLLFRLTANPRYMRDYRVRTDEQYFEQFMGYTREVFVDAGGYDGDTTEAFCKRYPDYRKVFFFEPSLQNMTAARQRLNTVRDVHYRNLGLSDVAGTLSFDSGSGSASAIQNSGMDLITVNTLDQVVNEPVTFIKMDLEGWELKALAGAQMHITQDRPKLALAVYHQAADFRLIHDYVSSFDHGYKVYLRHYTQGWSETVMFFR
jgi:FkbM family methyltransferase